jgi:hypothetical protein
MSERFDGDEDVDPHQTIWLQPWCKGCQKNCYSDGRQWCEDEVWGECEECGRKPVKYVLAGAVGNVRSPHE